MYKFICANISKSRNFTSSYRKLVQNKKIHHDVDKTRTVVISHDQIVEENTDENQDYIDGENRNRETPRKPSPSLIKVQNFPASSNLPTLETIARAPTQKIRDSSKFFTGHFVIADHSTSSISKKYYHLYSINPCIVVKRSYSTSNYKRFLSEASKETYKRALEQLAHIQRKKSDFEFKHPKLPGMTSDGVVKKHKRKLSKTEITYPTHTIKHNLTLTKRFKIREGPAEEKVQESEQTMKIRKRLQNKMVKSMLNRNIVYPSLMEHLKKGRKYSVDGRSVNEKSNNSIPLIEIISRRKVDKSRRPNEKREENEDLNIPGNLEEDFHSLVKSHPVIENASKEVKMKLKTKFIQLLLKTTKNFKGAEIESSIKNVKNIDKETHEAAKEKSENESDRRNIAECAYPKTILNEPKDVEQMYSSSVYAPIGEVNINYEIDGTSPDKTAPVSIDHPEEPPKLNLENIEKAAGEVPQIIEQLKQLQLKSDQEISTLKTNSERIDISTKLEGVKAERNSFLEELKKLNVKFSTLNQQTKVILNKIDDFKTKSVSEKLRIILTGNEACEVTGDENRENSKIIKNDQVTKSAKDIPTYGRSTQRKTDTILEVDKTGDVKITKKTEPYKQAKELKLSHAPLIKPSKQAQNNPLKNKTAVMNSTPKLTSGRRKSVEKMPGALPAQNSMSEDKKARIPGFSINSIENTAGTFLKTKSLSIEQDSKKEAFGKALDKGQRLYEDSVDNILDQFSYTRDENKKKSVSKEKAPCEEKAKLIGQDVVDIDRNVKVALGGDETDANPKTEMLSKESLDDWTKIDELNEQARQSIEEHLNRKQKKNHRRRREQVKDRSDGIRIDEVKPKHDRTVDRMQEKIEIGEKSKIIIEKMQKNMTAEEAVGIVEKKVGDDSCNYENPNEPNDKLEEKLEQPEILDTENKKNKQENYMSEQETKIKGKLDEFIGKKQDVWNIIKQRGNELEAYSTRELMEDKVMNEEKDMGGNQEDLNKWNDIKAQGAKLEAFCAVDKCRMELAKDDEISPMFEGTGIKRIHESIENTKNECTHGQEHTYFNLLHSMNHVIRTNRLTNMDQCFDANIPSEKESVYIPRENLVVNDIKSADDFNASKKKGGAVAVLKPGDEIILLRQTGVEQKEPIKEVKTQEQVTLALLNDALPKTEFALNQNRSLMDTRSRIDEMTEQIKNLEVMIKQSKGTTTGEKKSENKPRVLPPTKPKGDPDRKDISKDKPKGPKDIVLPPKIRGSKPDNIPKAANKLANKDDATNNGGNPKSRPNFKFNFAKTVTDIVNKEKMNYISDETRDVTETSEADEKETHDEKIRKYFVRKYGLQVKRSNAYSVEKSNLNPKKTISIDELATRSPGDKISIKKVIKTPRMKSNLRFDNNTTKDKLQKVDSKVGKNSLEPENCTSQLITKSPLVEMHKQSVSCPPVSRRSRPSLRISDKNNRDAHAQRSTKSSAELSKTGIHDIKTKFSSWSTQSHSGNAINGTQRDMEKNRFNSMKLASANPNTSKMLLESREDNKQEKESKSSPSIDNPKITPLDTTNIMQQYDSAKSEQNRHLSSERAEFPKQNIKSRNITERSPNVFKADKKARKQPVLKEHKSKQSVVELSKISPRSFSMNRHTHEYRKMWLDDKKMCETSKKKLSVLSKTCLADHNLIRDNPIGKVNIILPKLSNFSVGIRSEGKIAGNDRDGGMLKSIIGKSCKEKSAGISTTRTLNRKLSDQDFSWQNNYSKSVNYPEKQATSDKKAIFKIQLDGEVFVLKKADETLGKEKDNWNPETVSNQSFAQSDSILKKHVAQSSPTWTKTQSSFNPESESKENNQRIRSLDDNSNKKPIKTNKSNLLEKTEKNKVNNLNEEHDIKHGVTIPKYQITEPMVKYIEKSSDFGRIDNKNTYKDESKTQGVGENNKMDRSKDSMKSYDANGIVEDKFYTSKIPSRNSNQVEKEQIISYKPSEREDEKNVNNEFINSLYILHAIKVKEADFSKKTLKSDAYIDDFAEKFGKMNALHIEKPKTKKNVDPINLTISDKHKTESKQSAEEKPKKLDGKSTTSGEKHEKSNADILGNSLYFVNFPTVDLEENKENNTEQVPKSPHKSDHMENDISNMNNARLGENSLVAKTTTLEKGKLFDSTAESSNAPTKQNLDGHRCATADYRSRKMDTKRPKKVEATYSSKQGKNNEKSTPISDENRNNPRPFSPPNLVSKENLVKEIELWSVRLRRDDDEDDVTLDSYANKAKTSAESHVDAEDGNAPKLTTGMKRGKYILEGDDKFMSVDKSLRKMGQKLEMKPKEKKIDNTNPMRKNQLKLLTRSEEIQQQSKQEMQRNARKCKLEGHLRRQEKRYGKNIVANMNDAAIHIVRKQEENVKGSRKQRMYEKGGNVIQPSVGIGPWEKDIKKHSIDNNENQKSFHSDTNIPRISSEYKLLSKSEYLRIKKLHAKRKVPSCDIELHHQTKGNKKIVENLDVEFKKSDAVDAKENVLELDSKMDEKLDKCTELKHNSSRLNLSTECLTFKVAAMAKLMTNKVLNADGGFDECIEKRGNSDLVRTSNENSNYLEKLNYQEILDGPPNIKKSTSKIDNEIPGNKYDIHLKCSKIQEFNMSEEKRQPKDSKRLIDVPPRGSEDRQNEINKLVELKGKNKLARRASSNIEQLAARKNNKLLKSSDQKILLSEAPTIMADKTDKEDAKGLRCNLKSEKFNHQRRPRNTCKHKAVNGLLAAIPSHGIRKSSWHKISLPNAKFIAKELMDDHGTTLQKPICDDIKGLPKEKSEEKVRKSLQLCSDDQNQSDPMDKYRHLRISYMSVSKLNKDNDEAFLPASGTVEKKIVDENGIREIINYRFQLLKRLNEDFRKYMEEQQNKGTVSSNKFLKGSYGNTNVKKIKKGTTIFKSSSNKKNEIKAEDTKKNSSSTHSENDDKNGLGGVRPYSTN